MANPTPNPKPLVTSGSAPKAEPDDSELVRLRRENVQLRQALDAAGVRVDPPGPVAPSFGMSEGTREELERTGKATDPFTGDKLTKEDLPA